LLLCFALGHFAIPADAADTPGGAASEARLKALTEELRCLTCMGQSIADSNSGFSEDMRREIRELMAKGRSDAQIIEFMVQRYGDFVLYRPPLKSTTWLLWAGPFVLLGLALTVLIAKLRKRSRRFAPPPLSAADHEIASRLLQGKEENA
jgi:cytochrome c-type biogenesis protein CcmH